MKSLPSSVDSSDSLAAVELSVRQIVFRFFVIGVIAVIVLELVLRTAFITPSRQIFDAELGWQYIPNSKIIYSSEGYAVHNLNELGMNDESLASKVHQEKILVLGDSFTEALEVPRANNFVSQLDDRFESIDFINAGRGAYAPSHQLIVKKRVAKYLQASQNLLFLSHGDMRDLIAAPVMLGRGATGEINALMPVSHDKDAIKDRFRGVLHNSALATYIMRRYHLELKSAVGFVQNPCVWRCQKGETLAGEHLSDDVKTKAVERGRVLQLEMLAYILKELNEANPTAVFYIPNIVYKVQRQAEISEYSKGELQVIDTAMANNALPFYNLAQVFIEDYKKTGQPAFGFNNTKVGGEGHLNSHGHKVVADFVHSTLKITP